MVMYKRTRAGSARASKRVKTAIKAKYEAPTASNQRQQILGNAQDIAMIRSLMPKNVYTDYQYSGIQETFIAQAPFPFSTLGVSELMTPALWKTVMRQDANVVVASTTKIERMQLNLRWTLRGADYLNVTTFVVTLRKNAANRIISSTGLQLDQDYIVSTTDKFGVRLNPAVFDVKYSKNINLTCNGWDLDPTRSNQVNEAFNPQTTFETDSTSMSLNWNLKEPTGAPWLTMNQDQLAPYQRLYLLSFFQGKTGAVDDIASRLSFDALYTCCNAS